MVQASTLIKMLGGAHQPDEGEIRLQGESIQIQGPQDALAAGVAVIYQEFNLVLGYLPAKIFSWARSPVLSVFFLLKRAKPSSRLFRQLGVDIDPETLCRDLTVAQQQIVEIAKALATNARILVMDEPSAALSQNEIEGLFTVIRGLKEKDIGIIYISHRLDEIDTICDRATVLRDGEYIGTSKVGELSREELIQQMVGRSIEQEFQRNPLRLVQPCSLLKTSTVGRKSGYLNRNQER